MARLLNSAVLDEAEREQPTGVQPGCLVAAGLFILGVVLVTALTVLPGRGDESIALGRTDDYEPGEVVYHSTERFFVVRPATGAVIVLSDLDPHNPPRRSSCRVTFRPDLGPADAPGLFFDACTGSVYDITGRGLAGDGLDLRRVPVREDEEGRLLVTREDVARR